MSYFKPIPDENFIADVAAKWMVDIIAVIMLAWYLVLMFGVQVNVEGNSMSGLLSDGDTVLVNKMDYAVASPDRLDVVYFEKDNSNVTTGYIKRIVGVPGDTLQVIDGVLYVNNQPLEYQSDREAIVNAGSLTLPVTLDRNEYFVIGDNWNNSEDSRWDAIGIIKKSDIVGKVWLRSTPFKDIGLIQ